MKPAAAILLLFSAAAFTGCEHPYARLSTLQDPKYPITRDSAIALPDYENPQNTDLANRLAGETIEQQMRAMGFHIAPPSDAAFQLSFKIVDKEVSQTYTVSVPTISNMVGTAGSHPVSGSVFGDQVVPQTRMVTKTQLDIQLQKTQEPKVEVWQGRIVADAADARQYPVPFFRALLERIGQSANGDVQLDAGQPATK
jgi:hypothetical protein